MRLAVLMLFALGVFAQSPRVDFPLQVTRKIAIDPREYGAAFNGTTDDTDAWELAIDAAIDQGRSIECPGGLTSKVSKQGTAVLPFDGLQHSYVFLITGSLQISGYCNITLSMTDAATANVFWFQDTENVRVSGITFTGTGSQSTQKLYDGAGVLFDRCSNCRGFDLKSFNMRGNLLAFNSYDVGCTQCFSSASPLGKQGSHWGAFSCVGAIFSDNTGYGGTTDGDISLFGSAVPPVGNKVVNNRLYNYAWGDTTKTIVVNTNQGYTIDAGQSGALISGNYAYGYYYCIDNKTQSNGTIITANTTEKCKVGVAVRRGEIDILNQNVMISSNTIRPLGGNGNATSFDGLTDTLGIYIQDSFGVIVANNVIEASWIFGDGEQDFIPIYAKTTSSPDYCPTCTNPLASEFTDGLNIHSNIFAMEQQQGSTYTYADNSIVVVTGNATNIYPKVRIKDNSIKFRTDDAITHVPIVITQGYMVDVSGNQFGFQPLESGLYTITCDTCTLLSVNNNTLSQFGGFLSVTDSDQIMVQGNLLYNQTRDLASNPIPLIFSDTSTNWTIIGNQRIQPAGNVDNGRFFETAAAGTENVVMVKNIMDQQIFEDDFYEINGTVNANTADVMTLDNLRLGPLDGPMRTFSGVSGSIGGGALLAGACDGANVTSIRGVYPGMLVDVYPTNPAAPGAQFFYKANVTAHNTIAVSVCAATAGTPTATTYQLRVRQ